MADSDKQNNKMIMGMFPSRLDLAIALVAVVMALYHLINVYYSVVGTIEHRMIHLGLALTLVFLGALKAKRGRWFWWLLIVATLAVVTYLWLNLERLLFNIGFPTPPDVVVGFAVVFIVFTACYASFGFILPLMACLLLAYGFWGYLLGGPILSVNEIITTVDLTFGSYDLWGSILVISANVIFLFILFGGMLAALGANDFPGAGQGGGALFPLRPGHDRGDLLGPDGHDHRPGHPQHRGHRSVHHPPNEAGGLPAGGGGQRGGGGLGRGPDHAPHHGRRGLCHGRPAGVPYADIISSAAIPAVLYFISVGFFVHFSALKNRVAP